MKKTTPIIILDHALVDEAEDAVIDVAGVSDGIDGDGAGVTDGAGVELSG